MKAIEERLGFFPPFLAPAVETPEILENLWQQTVGSYLNNPLPALFKEKLFAYLSRFCSAPYFIVCHSCALRSLGLLPGELLRLLESRVPRETDIEEHCRRLAVTAGPLSTWPEPGSSLEEGLLACAIFMFVKPEHADPCRVELGRLLGPSRYKYLTAFLSYVKTCHLWADAHQDLSYEADKRVQEHFGALLEEEPRLFDFFRNYSFTPWAGTLRAWHSARLLELFRRYREKERGEQQQREQCLRSEVAELKRVMGVLEETLRKTREDVARRAEERTTEFLQRVTDLEDQVNERKGMEMHLRASLKEKDVLLEELHHRLKNNLQLISSLLSLQSKYLKHEKAQEVLQDCQNRIHSMALIHERLRQSTDRLRVDFAESVRSLVGQLFHSYGGNAGAITLQFDLEPLVLEAQAAISCGLIVNELASNALKHAFPEGRGGEIRIGLHGDERQVRLTVADNGVGLLPTLDIRQSDSLGLQLVTTLTDQLHGTLECVRDGGTVFRIVFPR